MAETRDKGRKPDRHPRRELARLAAGSADREEAKRAVRHLLAGCPACGTWLSERLQHGHGSPAAIADVLDGAEARAEALSREVAARFQAADVLVAELRSLPPERRRLVVANSARAASAPVVYRLIEESRTHRHQSAHETLHFAELAVTAAGRIAGRGVAAATAAAWAELANARRIASDLAGAEAALHHAEELAADCGPDPHFEAELLSLRGSVANYRRDFPTAERAVRRAAHLFARCADAEGAIRCLLQLAHVHERRGEPEHGIRPAQKAVDLAVATGARRLELISLQNLLHLIAESGEIAKAAELLPRVRRLFLREAPALDRLRFEWMAARIERRMGRPGRAAATFDELRERYARQGMPYEAALVSLDLAAALFDLGQRREIARIADETAELFRTLGVAREALMALGQLARARAEEAAQLLPQLATAVEATRVGECVYAWPVVRT